MLINLPTGLAFAIFNGNSIEKGKSHCLVIPGNGFECLRLKVCFTKTLSAFISLSTLPRSEQPVQEADGSDQSRSILVVWCSRAARFYRTL